ncbi:MULTISPECIES: 23S rRNA (guanine(1835)-N(2))-methyltransferase RlmG [unclassified Tatumella]|uniref:23S rRNA (guanine(1835)-N(2))-methyltransferase RlmG n=1 Tax=unclassified Tatumella TaxID=2649542 RepID=UPI001BB04A36|nr:MULTISPECIES: 23S rRNA (guanine(1835)-N(2))-methyltransferase RlmG [unclassified Tatumella]MBS0876776.1 23S rRNA (guanine(1835)-N(2))-methyltransferase RlmG [Tatumella sp. JGM82]MBS0889799.1 23S rRNA (guanine(1835)-N(2))-methyltransferase RlmG [Tatumella sp. JGM94]MBS0901531.1 23S rRNA (guanine(1835)-N(2))-methyltransferase RlmG [Tatumella sp. JGM100]
MSQFELSDFSLTLHRFPRTGDDNALQAWDAADEYLLQQELPPGPVAVFNDNFGALTCVLLQSGRRVWHISDSLNSQQATQINLAENQLDESQVTFLGSMTALTETPAAVLIKVPKTLALLEYQLVSLRPVLTAETVIIGGAKVKDIHNSTLGLFERIIGETKTSLAKKKARLIFSQRTVDTLTARDLIERWPLEGTPYTIHNHANVFSRQSLDIGARFFMRHLPRNLEGDIIDLGCGNGVIGLTALTHNPDAAIHFVDESMMAVASARLTIEQNLPEDLSRCHFTVNNALSGFSADSYAAVLCNPPFHQQNAVTDHVAWQMFRDAFRCLQHGGEFRVVANRHLDHQRKLKKLFGNCQLVASNSKFVVLRSVKLR